MRMISFGSGCSRENSAWLTYENWRSPWPVPSLGARACIGGAYERIGDCRVLEVAGAGEVAPSAAGAAGASRRTAEPASPADVRDRAGAGDDAAADGNPGVPSGVAFA